MCLIDDDHMIQTLSANGSDQTLHVRALPRTQRAGDDLCDSHVCHATADRVAVDAVAVSQQPPWGPILGERVDQLLGRPGRCRMFGTVDVDYASSLVRQQDEHEQQSTGQRRDGEEIHRHHDGQVIGQERPPRLGQRTTPTRQQSRDRAFGDIEPELAEFAVNARRAPQRVADAISETSVRIS